MHERASMQQAIN